MKVLLRPVTASDVRQIFEWRNAPAVRKNFFNPRKVGWPEHKLYWSRRLRSRTDWSLMVVAGGENAGLVRLDKVGSKGYEVSIMIPPHMWGRGIGTAALNMAKRFAKKKKLGKLYARIRPGNARSVKAFEAAGFKFESLNYIFNP